ncbi:Fc.00g091470.m01.CDS01 [Cosmosporella sp. VM-42]
MDLDTTPSNRKRAHSRTDDVVPTPTPLKRRRLDELSTIESPSTPKALHAISGVFGNTQRPRETTNVTDEIPDSEAEREAQAPQPPPQAKPTPSFRPAIKLKALKGTIWDNGEVRKPVLPKKVGPGRPRKTPAADGSATKPKSTGKGRGRKRKDQDAVEGLSIEVLGESPTKVQSVKRLNGHANGDRDSTDELSVHDLISESGRKTAATRLFDSPHGSPMPKGILTPTKKRGPRGRKSVTFGRDDNGEVFFEDLPKKSRTPKKAAIPAEDEIVCEICSKPDSKAPNQIILCDNCDFAVHQECYEVTDIPEGDWLCKSCAQEDVLKTPKKITETETPTTTTEVEVPDIPNLDQHVRSLQRVLLDRCTGRRKIQMFAQLEAHEKVHQLIEQTVVAGEGNSMLLIGTRGCGKTTLLEGIIGDLKREHHQEFHVVRLNGFIHTDDKLALKEIWRQLGKEMEVEDDLVNRTNYADTMASLLALLSHPSEILGTDEGVTSQSIVFIIDEFDMFASHPRQTLLYNLFDVAQSRKAPIAVLGCTTRLDVVEMLEKRVKSRFSHRYVYLSLPKSLPAYWQVCRQGLMVDSDDARKEGIDTDLEGYAGFQKYWSYKIEELYKQRSFQDLLQYHYYTTKSPSAFFTEWILPLSSLSGSDVTLATPSVDGGVDSLTPPDSRMHLLSTLSDLDLGLLIAAARLDIVAHTDTVNFAMAYDEYSSLMGRQRVQSATSGMLAVGGVRVWSRGVAGIAWERLISLGLLVPAGIGGSRTLGHGGLEGKMWKVDVALEEIPSAVKLSTVLARWCREI